MTNRGGASARSLTVGVESPSLAGRACPACGTDCVAARNPFTYCRACGHRWRYTSIAEQEAINGGVYHDHYPGYREDPVFRQAIRETIAGLIAPRVAPGASLLDMGCGAGALVEAAAELGFEARGIDISPASARICRERGLDAVAGDFLTHDFGQRFDAITLWDVMEHLREPAAFLARAHDLLTPGGYLFAKVPAYGALSVGVSRRVPRMSRMLLNAPGHVQYFNAASLGALGTRMGFSVEWMPGLPAMRSRVTGGTIKRRVGRYVARTIRSASGDTNLYLAAAAIK